MTPANQTGYRPPAFSGPIELNLSRNESDCAIKDLAPAFQSVGRETLSDYPLLDELQAQLAARIGVDTDRVVVTAGGDEGIDRIFRWALSSDPHSERRKFVCHQPSFEMFDVYSRINRAEQVGVDWTQGPFPVDEFTANLDGSVALAAIVSPNNPTGLLVSVDSMKSVIDAASGYGTPLLFDLAYVEFAAEDPTNFLITQDNVLIVRTLSKAWGMAGLRIGYVIAPDPETATAIRDSGGPFPVSAVSIQLALEAFRRYPQEMQNQVRSIVDFRVRLARLIERGGGSSLPSEGNFLLARFENSQSVCQSLAKRGIAVRQFPNRPLLENQLRITVPANRTDFQRLQAALCQTLNIKELPMPEPSSQEIVAEPAAETRQASVTRKTKETDISVEIDLDGNGDCNIATRIGFLDHMLTAFSCHSGIDLQLHCQGDIDVDDHHTTEDSALSLGAAIDRALGDRMGITRFGHAYAPLDEALARVVIDLSGRPSPQVHLDLQREMIGTIATENITHFFQSLATSLRCSLHVDVLRGENDHHKAEAAFKALALAIKQAVQVSGTGIPSTKGTL